MASKIKHLQIEALTNALLTGTNHNSIIEDGAIPISKIAGLNIGVVGDVFYIVNGATVSSPDGSVNKPYTDWSTFLSARASILSAAANTVLVYDIFNTTSNNIDLLAVACELFVVGMNSSADMSIGTSTATQTKYFSGYKTLQISANSTAANIRVSNISGVLYISGKVMNLSIDSMMRANVTLIDSNIYAHSISVGEFHLTSCQYNFIDVLITSVSTFTSCTKNMAPGESVDTIYDAQNLVNISLTGIKTQKQINAAIDSAIGSIITGSGHDRSYVDNAYTCQTYNTINTMTTPSATKYQMSLGTMSVVLDMPLSTIGYVINPSIGANPEMTIPCIQAQKGVWKIYGYDLVDVIFTSGGAISITNSTGTITYANTTLTCTSINTRGTGYVVGDHLVFDVESNEGVVRKATATVASVTAGAVTAVTKVSGGLFHNPYTNNMVKTYSSTGSNCYVTITQSTTSGSVLSSITNPKIGDYVVVLEDETSYGTSWMYKYLTSNGVDSWQPIYMINGNSSGGDSGLGVVPDDIYLTIDDGILTLTQTLITKLDDVALKSQTQSITGGWTFTQHPIIPSISTAITSSTSATQYVTGKQVWNTVAAALTLSTAADNIPSVASMIAANVSPLDRFAALFSHMNYSRFKPQRIGGNNNPATWINYYDMSIVGSGGVTVDYTAASKTLTIKNNTQSPTQTVGTDKVTSAVSSIAVDTTNGKLTIVTSPIKLASFDSSVAQTAGQMIVGLSMDATTSVISATKATIPTFLAFMDNIVFNAVPSDINAATGVITLPSAMASTAASNVLSMSINGKLIYAIEDFTVTSTTSITIVTASYRPSASDVVRITYRKATGLDV